MGAGEVLILLIPFRAFVQGHIILSECKIDSIESMDKSMDQWFGLSYFLISMWLLSLTLVPDVGEAPACYTLFTGKILLVSADRYFIIAIQTRVNLQVEIYYLLVINYFFILFLNCHFFLIYLLIYRLIYWFIDVCMNEIYLFILSPFKRRLIYV